MLFLCKKTVEMPLEEIAFVENRIYQDFPRATSRTYLALINEQGFTHTVGLNFFGWRHDNFFKEHFEEINPDDFYIIKGKNGTVVDVLGSTLISVQKKQRLSR